MIYSTLYLRSCSNGYRRKEERQLHGRHFVRCLLDTKLNALADKIESALVKTWWNWESKQSSFRRILYTLHHHFTLFMYFTLFFNLLYLVLCTLLGNHSVEYITLHIAFAGTSYSIMLIHLFVEPACQWYVTSNVSSSFVVHSLIVNISVELGKLHAFQHFFLYLCWHSSCCVSTLLRQSTLAMEDPPYWASYTWFVGTGMHVCGCVCAFVHLPVSYSMAALMITS